MNEKFSGEKSLASENLEDKQKEHQEAKAEMSRIKRDIEHILAITPDREEAEKIIQKKLLPSMEEARTRMEEAKRACGNN